MEVLAKKHAEGTPGNKLLQVRQELLVNLLPVICQEPLSAPAARLMETAFRSSGMLRENAGARNTHQPSRMRGSILTVPQVFSGMKIECQLSCSQSTLQVSSIEPHSNSRRYLKRCHLRCPHSQSVITPGSGFSSVSTSTSRFRCCFISSLSFDDLQMTGSARR